MFHRKPFTLLVASGFALSSSPSLAQSDESLAAYFGFDEQRILVIDDNAGPMIHADFNGDGRPDLAVANNQKSRIELHTLRTAPRTDAELERDVRVNEIRPNRHYDRSDVSVRHRVDALLTFDADADGKSDLVYASRNAGEIVVLRQVSPDRFETLSSRRLQNLQASPAALSLITMDGGERALACLVGSSLTLVPIDGQGKLGSPRAIGSADGLRAVFADDFDGDGRQDLMTAAPSDDAPVRVWLQRAGVSASAPLSARFPGELRFEMPSIIEAEPVHTPDRDGASIAVIEQASRRVVLYDLVTTDGSDADVATQAEIIPFADENATLIASDLNGDGRGDLLVTRPSSNAVAMSISGSNGLGSPREFPTFKAPSAIDAGVWPDASSSSAIGVFTLSEEENAVGVSRVGADGSLAFPAPIPLATPGATPVTLRRVELGDRGPALAVLTRKRRDLFVEVHYPDSTGRAPVALELERVTKAPSEVLAYDADRDGDTDLLLLTPGEPPILLPGEVEDGELKYTRVLQSDDMPQFGLVSAAGPNNAVVHDTDGDGAEELLIATDNFLRIAAFDAPQSGKGGWRVVGQQNDADPATRFTGLARMGDGAFLAADGARGRLVTFRRDRGGWTTDGQETRVRGVDLGRVITGPYGAGGSPAVLAVNGDGYAIIPRTGARRTLEEVSVYRSDSEDRVEHEIEVGDVNGDGYTDLVVLDAGEQMCQVLTLTASRRLVEAMEFKVFESRMFRGGDQREFEPSAAIVTDLTGDGHDDVLLLVHDRLIIYPQQRP